MTKNTTLLLVGLLLLALTLAPKPFIEGLINGLYAGAGHYRYVNPSYR